MILYWPVPSVTTERVFSMSAGLEASTVTPGKTAPVTSLTTPAMLLSLCASKTAGTARIPTLATVARRIFVRLMVPPRSMARGRWRAHLESVRAQKGRECTVGLTRRQDEYEGGRAALVLR